MNKLLILAFAMVTTTSAFAAADYAVNVWISTAGTGATYSLGQGPVSLDEVRAAAKKVAALAPEQTAHVIADEKTSMASLFALSKSIREGGLTNIVVSVFCSAPTSTSPNRVKPVAGMSLDIRDVHDVETLENNRVQPPHALCQAEWEAWTPEMLVEKTDLIGIGILGEVTRVQANNKTHCEGTIRFSEWLKGTTKEVVLKWDVGKPPVEDEMDYAASAGRPLLWFLKRNQDGSFFVPHGDGIQNISRKAEFTAIIKAK